MLFSFYAASAGGSRFSRTDLIFPAFVATQMPHVVSGFLIAAILAAAMSNLSAALNSLSSTVVVDFYTRLVPQSTEERRVRLSRIITVAWAVLLFALALLARLFRHGQISYHGGFVDVATSRSVPLPVDPLLWRRIRKQGRGVKTGAQLTAV